MKKKTLLIGAAAITATLAGGWALAQSHGPGFGPPFMHGEGYGGMGPGMGPGMMHRMHGGMGPGMGRGGMGPGMGFGGPAAFADPAQFDRLKTELGITATQEPAWTKYAKTVQDAAAAMKGARETMNPDTVGKMTPDERYAFATKMREQGQKQFETVKAAADGLLKTLDDSQKAKAETLLPGLAFGHAPMRGAFMGGPFHR